MHLYVGCLIGIDSRAAHDGSVLAERAVFNEDRSIVPDGYGAPRHGCIVVECGVADAPSM